MVAIVGAVLGGSGFVGIVFHFMKRYIEKKLMGAEEEDKKRKKLRITRTKVEDELHHAYGRMFYHIHKFIETGFHNGDLEEAYQQLQEAEAKKRDLDRDVIAEREQE